MNAIDRIDLRRRRADRLVAAVMSEANKNPAFDDIYREMIDLLFKVLTEEGAEILTDYDRAQCGLPPRGPDGWTAEEMIELERRRLEWLSKPLTFSVPSWEATREQSVDLGVSRETNGGKPRE